MEFSELVEKETVASVRMRAKTLNEILSESLRVRVVHYKGGVYFAVGFTNDKTTGRLHVRYTDGKKPGAVPYTRPAEEFCGAVTNEAGKTVWRYEFTP